MRLSVVKSSPRAKRVTAAITVAILTLLLFAILMLRRSSSDTFNSERWKSSVEARRTMLYDLRRPLRPGLTRREIEELLGAPDRQYQAHEYAYCLGVERSSFVSIDHEWLIISFSGDTVAAVNTRPD